jgi:hypothetical protein
MKKLMLPLILLILGSGSGVAAGLFLVKPPEDTHALDNPCGDLPAGDSDPALAPPDPEAIPAAAVEGGPSETLGYEYVRLANQFIVPVVKDGVIAAMVVLSISVEVPTGQSERTFAMEPKLRDVFLQELFDHANTGGFDGLFTATSTMQRLRDALRTAAEREVPGLVRDVLIIEIVRQDN